MPARKPLALWIVVSLFIASAAAVSLTGRLLRQPVAPPRTVTELVALMSRYQPSLYVIPQADGKLENGVWVCVTQRSLEQLSGLMRLSECAHCWQGVVYCEIAARWGGAPKEVEDEQLQGWGEYGMRIGSLLFFGDPVLLQCIRKVILDYQRDKSSSLTVQRRLLRIAEKTGAATLVPRSNLPRKPSLRLHTRAVLLSSPDWRFPEFMCKAPRGSESSLPLHQIFQ